MPIRIKLLSKDKRTLSLYKNAALRRKASEGFLSAYSCRESTPERTSIREEEALGAVNISTEENRSVEYSAHPVRVSGTNLMNAAAEARIVRPNQLLYLQLDVVRRLPIVAEHRCECAHIGFQIGYILRSRRHDTRLDYLAISIDLQRVEQAATRRFAEADSFTGTHFELDR